MHVTPQLGFDCAPSIGPLPRRGEISIAMAEKGILRMA